MKKIIFNKYNIKDDEVSEIVKRVKVLLIDSNNEILIGYSYNVYQFIGGHVEENESLHDAIIRETKEESGITLNIDNNIKPFAVFEGYYKDYPKNGMNRKNEIYYYEIKSDEIPDLKNTNYTKEEIQGKYELRKVPMDTLEQTIIDNVKLYGNPKGIADEMLGALKIYREMK